MNHFCIAYIDTVMHNAMAQAPVVAKYDMAIVSLMQDMSVITPWLDKARAINPKLRLIAYIQAATEDLTPSIPGAVQRDAHSNAWLPGFLYYGRRYADYRSFAWRDAFLSACEVTMGAYPINGMFIDNCSVWAGHVRLPGDGPRQAEGLQSVITELRQRHPRSILIGNTTEKWGDLNGELNENRPELYPFDMQPAMRHADPEMKLGNVYSDDPEYISAINSQAKMYGAWFGASPSCQEVRWYDCFEDD